MLSIFGRSPARADSDQALKAEEFKKLKNKLTEMAREKRLAEASKKENLALLSRGERTLIILALLNKDAQKAFLEAYGKEITLSFSLLENIIEADLLRPLATDAIVTGKPSVKHSSEFASALGLYQEVERYELASKHFRPEANDSGLVMVAGKLARDKRLAFLNLYLNQLSYAAIPEIVRILELAELPAILPKLIPLIPQEEDLAIDLVKRATSEVGAAERQKFVRDFFLPILVKAKPEKLAEPIALLKDEEQKIILDACVSAKTHPAKDYTSLYPKELRYDHMNSLGFEQVPAYEDLKKQLSILNPKHQSALLHQQHACIKTLNDFLDAVPYIEPETLEAFTNVVLTPLLARDAKEIAPELVAFNLAMPKAAPSKDPKKLKLDDAVRETISKRIVLELEKKLSTYIEGTAMRVSKHDKLAGRFHYTPTDKLDAAKEFKGQLETFQATGALSKDFPGWYQGGLSYIVGAIMESVKLRHDKIFIPIALKAQPALKACK